jgi:hypothetical protein
MIAGPPRRLRLRIGLLLAASIALAACAYALVRDGAVDQTRAEAVEAGIQKMRALNFTAPVPIVVETRDEAQHDLEAELHREYSDEQIAADGQVGALIGLLPSGIDLQASMMALLRSQVAGFYDPEAKRMVLVEGAINPGLSVRTAQLIGQRDLTGELLLAHELTHALQDQHFAIQATLNKLKDNDDPLIAYKSVTEGDATLASFGYVAGRLDPHGVDLLIASLAGMPDAFAAQSGDTPQGLSEPLIFQYSAGTKFVAEAYRRGGWNAVDALYRDPPRSSRQIMHPELYFGHRIDPVLIALEGYQAALAGWQELSQNTVGELQLQIILRRGLGKDAPQLALADRWTGDRMVVMRNGTSLAVVWMLAFSDDRSAQQFAAAYTTILDPLLGAPTSHRIDYHEDLVLVTIGEGARRFNQLAPSVWSATKISRPARIGAAASVPSAQLGSTVQSPHAPSR